MAQPGGSHPQARILAAYTRRRVRERVRRHYRRHGRDLPWRRTDDPYAILASEIMLQQTQVHRVIPKYDAFLVQFPTAQTLADAPLTDVLVAWQGLGYNRRARLLQRAAQVIAHEYGGVVPDDPDRLQQLPGVGSYTARAVAVFAFNQPHILLETNVRTVLLHEVWPDAEDITDDELAPLARELLDRRNPREWHSALMDYGTYLKQQFGNYNRRSRHYTRQSQFEGSNRQLRGAILRELTRAEQGMTPNQLAHTADRTTEETQRQLDALAVEGLVEQQGVLYRIAAE